MMQALLTSLVLALWIGQSPPVPAYVREGDRVEGRFRSFRDELDRFYESLHETLARRAPEILEALGETPPPDPVVFGYQLLPPVEPAADVDGDSSPELATVRTYSWPLTEGYIDAETERLHRAEIRLGSLDTSRGLVAAELMALVEEYQQLVSDQSTIDQHVQYNRFWQRTVAGDRSAFDRLGEFYDLMLAGDPAASREIQELLGRPVVPGFVTVISGEDELVVRLPIDTDITDRAYLDLLEATAEQVWQVEDSRTRYRLDVVFRPVAPGSLYPGGSPPASGARIDLAEHLERFGSDAAVLTTGAESTHAYVGRAVFLGGGALTTRTLAHEFGHLLGFRDGYLRTYEDLGDRGFEIRELTPDFADLMIAPRTGSVNAVHFQLISDETKARARSVDE